MTVPFPYVTPDDLERELGYSRDDTELDPTEWGDLLTDKLKQESERVESWTGQKWRTEDTPALIKAAVIRLTRAVLNQIDEAGLASESVGDWSGDFRPLSEIRAAVRSDLDDAEFGSGPNTPDDFRSTII